MPEDEFSKNYKSWEVAIGKLEDAMKEVANKGKDKFEGVDLLELYLKFQKRYHEMWRIGSLPEVSNWGGEQIIARELKKIFNEEAEYASVLESLSAPEKLSFYQQEEKDLLRLKLLENKEEIKCGLLRHQRKYYWMLNSYYDTRVLSVNYFKEVLEKHTKEEAKEILERIKNFTAKIQEKKKEIIKKHNLSQEIEKTASQLSFCIWWQDERKKYIFKANHCIDLFLTEISRKYGIAENSLHYYAHQEISALLQTHKLIDENEIDKRKKNFLGVYDSKVGESKYFSGDEAEELMKPFFTKKIDLVISEFRGTVVSRGLVRGEVKIITSPRETEKMEKGDVLVSPMTSPDLIVAMKKAAAIVTDEGGLTCHAAIVSRELGTPCIVGTKIATQVLRDGDLVEVDADKGKIKIIKRKISSL
ncbi:MAG: hypothetical protein HGA61_03620 [Candidatus Moranbacteria bacterium]|nr:hypothetical protein [Candidatus Moranbacteria bacterium]